MESEQQGERIKTLHSTVSEIATIYQLANPTGIRAIKFMNSKRGLLNVRRGNLDKHFNEMSYNGIRRIGSTLKSKILSQYVSKNSMKRPLLIVVITGGEVGSPTSIYMALTKSLKQPSRRANLQDYWETT